MVFLGANSTSVLNSDSDEIDYEAEDERKEGFDAYFNRYSNKETVTKDPTNKK